MGLTEEMELIRQRWVNGNPEPEKAPLVITAAPGDLKQTMDMRAQVEADIEAACWAAIDPKARAALEQARKSHQEATVALDKARAALAKHGDKPSGWKMGGNSSFYSKRDELARTVDHLIMDTAATEVELATHERTVNALLLKEVEKRSAAYVAEQPAKQAAFLDERVQTRQRMNAHREEGEAIGRVLGRLTRKMRGPQPQPPSFVSALTGGTPWIADKPEDR